MQNPQDVARLKDRLKYRWQLWLKKVLLVPVCVINNILGCVIFGRGSIAAGRCWSFVWTQTQRPTTGPGRQGVRALRGQSHFLAITVWCRKRTDNCLYGVNLGFCGRSWNSSARHKVNLKWLVFLNFFWPQRENPWEHLKYNKKSTRESDMLPCFKEVWS